MGGKMKRKVFLTGLLGMLSIILVFGIFDSTAGTKKIKMTSVWSAGIQLIEIDKHFVKLVNELGGDQLQIKFFPGGSLVPAFEVFNAVREGTIPMGADWGGYWAGKNEAFNIIGSHPMGLTATDYMVWVYQAGGFELIQEVYGKYGLVCIPHGVHSAESGVRGHKAINTIADYKGMKIRMGGKIQGKVLKDLGGVQVMLAGSEVYQALEKGVVDACEYNTPTVDWNLGLAEVTEYWASPPWHAPAAIFGVMINKKVWDNFTEKQKEVLKTAAMANFLWSYTYFEYQDIIATRKFLEKGIKITRLKDEDLDKIQKIVNKHTMESAKTNPLFAKIAYSQYKFLNDLAEWRSISSPFSSGRNFVTPNLNELKAYTK